MSYVGYITVKLQEKIHLLKSLELTLQQEGKSEKALENRYIQREV